MTAVLIPQTDWKEVESFGTEASAPKSLAKSAVLVSDQEEQLFKTIPLTQGKVAIVDAEDYEYLSQWQWQAVFNYGTWYARTIKNGSQVSMHRLVYLRHSRNNPAVVRNKNGNKLDNRYSNLQSNGTVKIVPALIVPPKRDLFEEIHTTSRINFLLKQRLKTAFLLREAITLTNQIRTAPVTELADNIDALTIQLQEILEVMKP